MARKPKLRIAKTKTPPAKKKPVRTRSTDDATKDEAYELYLKHNKNLKKTAEELDVPRNTLRGWIEQVELKRRLAAAAEGPQTVKLAPTPDMGLLPLVEYVARQTLLEILVKLPRERVPALKATVHTLLQDFQMISGSPTSINRTESLNAQALDLTALTEEELLQMAALLRKSDPRTKLRHADPTPVILPGVDDDDDTPAAPPAPGAK